MAEELPFYQATMNDLDSIFEIVDSVGWGETKEDIRCVLRNPNNAYITVFDEESGQIIGITLAISYQKVGFIGHVIVLPEYQGMGIGQELMNEAIEWLKFKGCKTIKLDAVDKAVSLYERVGFKFEFNSLRYSYEISNEKPLERLLEKTQTVEQKFPVHTIKEHDIAEIFEVDVDIFEDDREKLLFSLFDRFPEYSFITGDTDDILVGYLFGSYQNGVLKLRAGVSDSYETTINLIKTAIISIKDDPELKAIKVGLLENSKTGVKALEQLGFLHYYTSLRMYWGEKTSASTNPSFIAIGDPAKG